VSRRRTVPLIAAAPTTGGQWPDDCFALDATFNARWNPPAGFACALDRGKTMLRAFRIRLAYSQRRLFKVRPLGDQRR
jgi:hypothetical protein